MTNRSHLARDLTMHPVSSYLNSLTSKNSKRTMLNSLRTVLAVALDEDPGNVDPMAVYEFAWHSLTPAKLNALKAAVLRRYSRATASLCLTAVRQVLGACFDLELIDGDQLMRLERVKGVKVPRNRDVGRRLTDGEIVALARACADDLTPAGVRDEAILGLGYTQGPRISEIAKLKLDDYDPETGDLVIRNAKGGKTRVVRAANSTKESLDEWIEIRGDHPGRLFLAVDKTGRVVGETRAYRRNGKKIKAEPGMSTAAIGYMLKRRAEQASVKPFTMHDLRRTFLTNGWAIGIPGTDLQKIAGHASIETTASYDRGDQETALKNTAGRLHFPRVRNGNRNG